MTRDETINLVREVGAIPTQKQWCDVEHLFSEEKLERFVALVEKRTKASLIGHVVEALETARKEERAACAAACRALYLTQRTTIVGQEHYEECAVAIEERNK